MSQNIGFYLIILLIPFCLFGQSDIPIGTWRSHHSYYSARDLAVSEDRIYCAAGTGLFYLDKSDNSINKITKVDGLSDVGISALDYASNGTLTIGYDNGNIDFIQNSTITNYNLIKEASILGSRKINHAISRNNTIYIATDFGVVIFDLDELEVIETLLNIGVNGESLSVFESAFTSDSLFLATDEGVIASALSGANLQDFGSWRRYTNADGIAAVSIRNIASDGNAIYSGVNGQGVYKYVSKQWSLLAPTNEEIIAIDNSSGQLFVSLTSGLFEVSGGELQPLSNPLISRSNQVAMSDGNLLIADNENGLLIGSIQSLESAFPSGPFADNFYKLFYHDNKIIGLSGGFEGNAANRRSEGFYVYENGIWTNYNNSDNPGTVKIPEFKDIVDVSFNKKTKKYQFASFGYGLLEWDGQESFVVIDENSANVSLVNVSPPERNTQVTGIEQDKNNVSWILNYGTQSALHRINDGIWQSFELNNNNAKYSRELVIAGDNDKWIRIFENDGDGSGILVYNENIGERQLSTISGQGNLLSNEVNDLEVDNDGQVWVATSNGVNFFSNPFEVLEFNFLDANFPIFENRPLLRNKRVNKIEIDGGNRKWIGTDDGLWLFDEQTDQILERFTSADSPLFSDNIIDIAIHEKTGEVFIATDKGLVSFRSTAIVGKSIHQNVKVFPNPVPHEFDGLVGIHGLANDVTVKITDISGKLIHESKADGGGASWNVRDYNGNRAATGIYLIFSSTRDGIETFVAKVAVVN